jgi:uncharacterized damage-inducible protein DinB
MEPEKQKAAQGQTPQPRLQEPRLQEPRLQEPRLQEPRLQEPWLRGTRSEIAPVERAVLHSLEMAREDVAKWCSGLSEEELHTWPDQLASPAFHLRHIVRSLDRLLTYGEGGALSAAQMQALASEKDAQASKEELFQEFTSGLQSAEGRVLSNAGQPLDTPIKIGRKGLTTTRGGLLVHLAEHTQRHVGQAVTTAKLLVAQRSPARPSD